MSDASDPGRERLDQQERASNASGLAFERRRYELIGRVVELPPRDREAVFADSDPELAADVRSMLDAIEADGQDFLEPIAGAEAPVPDPIPPPIGPYRPLELLGEGGMGRVFLAEQNEPVKRRVALKVLRFAAAGREARARFQAERHAMGRLDHPNVGKILEAGTTPDGLPFFAMELIDGAPITEYADQRELPLADRLRLFAAVCRGVDHAHNKLLLHRDIKPSNVLVTEVDGAPVPKLIDFGIAKGLDDSLAGATLATGNRLIGTPGYMSPEALGLGGDVDTRSDVFSLGVLLYELLTGHRPWPESDDAPQALMRGQAGSDPERPSTCVSTLDDVTKDEVAERRGLESAELPRRLRGDLDWITLKAVAHAPAERYSSAADLAADVERFLADEPVSARDSTAGYLLRKLMRRHRGRVVAAAMVAGALVLGAVGTTVGLVRARAEAERANRQAEAARAARDRAVASQQTSDQLAASLVALFQSISPNDRRSANLTPMELLLRGVESVKSRLSDQPQAQGVLLGTLGDLLTSWDDFPAADTLLREAVRLLETPGQEPGDPLVRALRKLIYVSTMLGRHREALEFAARAQKVQEALGEAADPFLTARILVSGGGALRALGRLEEAESWLQRGLDLHRRINSSARWIGVVYIELGLVDGMRKDWPAVIEHNQAAIEIFEPRQERNHNRISVALGHAAMALIELGRLSEAEAAIARCRALPEQNFGPDSPRLLGVLYAEGVLWSRQGDYPASETALRRYLELQRQRRPAADPVITDGLSSLGWTLWLADDGRRDEAVALLTEALSLYRQASDPSYIGHLRTLFQLGQIDQAESRFDRAESRYREALELLEGFVDAPAVDLAEAYQGLAQALLAQGRVEEAREASSKAL